jgi:phosphatidylserine decarboxylase
MERGGSGFNRADTEGADHNVHLELGCEGDQIPFTVVMVSGWFARRIVPYVGIGDRLERGGRIGLIRFGSRVDVLVPKGTFDVAVQSGTRIRAGSSSLGVMTDAGR